MLAHAAIRDRAVIELLDNRWGGLVVADVPLQPGAPRSKVGKITEPGVTRQLR